MAKGQPKTKLAAVVRETIAKKMSGELGFSFREAQRVINVLVGRMVVELKRPDGRVKISGFGTLKAVTRKPRFGRNFQTGEIIRVPATRTVRLIPSKLFRNALNKQASGNE